ncbi:hypothetical protein FA95DRAFT_1565324 [Auriscalpium vulgare]|uniref:Uncharacterized protein n=1 Tax=Auriscalpium vulgare TaxID=40419 RepID=A0ACB8RBP9_9AGAM|nr:hypothetical protein FA95DRAFT_1565324 [Auriscalpium vulgare]
MCAHPRTTPALAHRRAPQLLTIMSSSIAYLTTRTNFVQLSASIPITKQRNPDKVDAAEVFEANKKELVADLMVKAKQVEYLVQSLPAPEPEEQQATRLEALEQDMQRANQEYAVAVARAKALHTQISDVLRGILNHNELADEAPG